MVRKINGVEFYEKPGCCGTCPFFDNGRSRLYPGSEKGYCRMFEEMHGTFINPPQRCKKLFNKAFKMPEGSNLVIVVNDSSSDL